MYGLLGLADRLDPYFKPVDLEVDYNKTLEQVFWDTVLFTAESLAMEQDIDLFAAVSVPHDVPPVEHDVLSRLQRYANAETTSGKRKMRARRAANVYAALMAGLRADHSPWGLKVIGLVDKDSEGDENQKDERENLGFRLQSQGALSTAITHACRHVLDTPQATVNATPGALLGSILAAKNLRAPFSDGRGSGSSMPESPSWVDTASNMQILNRKVVSSAWDSCSFPSLPAVKSLAGAVLLIPELGLCVHAKELSRSKTSAVQFRCTFCPPEETSLQEDAKRSP